LRASIPVNTLASEVSEPTASLETLKVLVVDDDQDCRDAMRQALRSLGHSCAIARDGLEAWEMYQAERADVILSDWKMPRMDGLDLCRKVRGDDSNKPYTHFIFITGNKNRADFMEGMDAGADDYVTKPVGIDELGACLEVARRAVIAERQLLTRNACLCRDEACAPCQSRRPRSGETRRRISTR
jgi:DNA-binding response OmpR family regulator